MRAAAEVGGSHAPASLKPTILIRIHTKGTTHQVDGDITLCHLLQQLLDMAHPPQVDQLELRMGGRLGRSDNTVAFVARCAAWVCADIGPLQ